jgi:hypothetical protein
MVLPMQARDSETQQQKKQNSHMNLLLDAHFKSATIWLTADVLVNRITPTSESWKSDWGVLKWSATNFTLGCQAIRFVDPSYWI